MDEITLEANIKINKKLYKNKLNDFKKNTNKTLLVNEYKNHNLRFSVIIDKNLATEKKDLEYAEFLETIINDMTREITMLNGAMKKQKITEVLKQLTFHEKVNIAFYVRPAFYNKNFEPYEILTDETFKELSTEIIKEANKKLIKYGKNLEEISKMNAKDIESLIEEKDLRLDILFATELLK